VRSSCCNITAVGTLSAASYTQSFTYDPLGRLTSGPLGRYTYGDSAHRHGAATIGGQQSGSYDAYGNLQGSQGSTVNPFAYDGQRYDALAGLYQLRARSYDPSSGRFLSRDTVLQPFVPAELSRYGYVQADPINRADPTGHASVEGCVASASEQTI
jgi:RHS repeat-associated protein